MRAPPSLTCDVIDYHGDSRVADVAGDETPETLLSGCVPQLQAHLREPTIVPEKQQEDKEERRERGEERKSSKRGRKRTVLGRTDGRREAREGGRQRA